MLRILLIVTSLLVGGWCRPSGPPLPNACQNQLVPQHAGTSPQNEAAPYSIEVEGSYVAGATLTGTVASLLLSECAVKDVAFISFFSDHKRIR